MSFIYLGSHRTSPENEEFIHTVMEFVNEKIHPLLELLWRKEPTNYTFLFRHNEDEKPVFCEWQK